MARFMASRQRNIGYKLQQTRSEIATGRVNEQFLGEFLDFGKAVHTRPFKRDAPAAMRAQPK